MSSNDKENDDERTTTTTTSPSKTLTKSASMGTSVLKQKYAALMESRNKYKEESEEAKRNVKALEKRVVQLEAELASPTNPDSLAVELAEVRARLEVASAALRAEKNRSMKNEGRAERVAKLERDLDEMVAARAKHTATTLTLGVCAGAIIACAAVAAYAKYRR